MKAHWFGCFGQLSGPAYRFQTCPQPTWFFRPSANRLLWKLLKNAKLELLEPSSANINQVSTGQILKEKKDRQKLSKGLNRDCLRRLEQQLTEHKWYRLVCEHLRSQHVLHGRRGRSLQTQPISVLDPNLLF